MLAAFCFASGLVQDTIGLSARNEAVARKIATKEAHLGLLQARYRELQATRTFLQSDAGILAAARPLGFGRPSERRVMFAPAR